MYEKESKKIILKRKRNSSQAFMLGYPCELYMKKKYKRILDWILWILWVIAIFLLLKAIFLG